MSGPNPFGTALRAARLGYHFSKRHRAYIRMAGDDPPFIVEVAPEGGPIPSKTATRLYRTWWEGEDGGERILEACGALKRFLNSPPTRHETILVGEDGEAAGRGGK